MTRKITDYTKLKIVDENSIEAKLYDIIDNIDTAIDVFKPEMKSYEKYICKMVDEKNKFIISDGYKLYYVD